MSRVFVINTPGDVRRCFSVMKELRPHLDLDSFLRIYEEAYAEKYRLAAIEDGGEIVAVMGYRIVHDMVRGKHLYVDDLVSTEKRRSQGLGAELLAWAEKEALKEKCVTLRLCAVLENTRGLQFYDRNGWTRRAYALLKKPRVD